SPLSFAGTAVARITGGLIPSIRWRGASTGVEQGPLSFAGWPVLSLAGIIHTPSQRAMLTGLPAAVAATSTNYASSTPPPPSWLSLAAGPDTPFLPPYCGTFFDNRIDASRLPLIRCSV